MSPNTSLDNPNFKAIATLSLLVALLAFGLSIYIGKVSFFLLLNNNLGRPADFFFRYVTDLGNGLLWILWLSVFLLNKQKHLLPLLLSAFLFSTLFTEIFKHIIYPGEVRPLMAVADESLVHQVMGVTVHTVHSFPSGHTVTAFTFALLFSLLLERKTVIAFGFIVAMLVGYSRIYLAQHFPLDVGAGIIIAVFSVVLSIAIQQLYDKRQLSNIPQEAMM